jgi:hypothetical protein
MRNCWSMSRHTILVMVVSMKKKWLYAVSLLRAQNAFTFGLSRTCFNCGSARGGGSGYYSPTCIKLAVFCYIMTVQNVVYVVCINLYTLYETPYTVAWRPVATQRPLRQKLETATEERRFLCGRCRSVIRRTIN